MTLTPADRALALEENLAIERGSRALLAQHGVRGKVEREHASLEDVFVAATRFNN
jgi:hypothetical protein